jgi:pyridoxal phosphate enzyme (YggS family)
MYDSSGISIRDSVAQVRGQIAAAAARAGRDPSSIKLVAVSKTKPVSAIYEAYGEGLNVFGENYAQELISKINSEPLSGLPDIEWHMIGHIQTNKVKMLIGKTFLIHSLDSIRLAETIQKHAEKASLTVDVLVEVNIAGEADKFGFSPAQTFGAVEQIARFCNIKILGLMASAPYTDDPESSRKYFKQLNELYLDIRHKRLDNTRMHILSMGMSGDFQVAIEEGSTMLRIGTRLFGSRDTGRH